MYRLLVLNLVLVCPFIPKGTPALINGPEVEPVTVIAPTNSTTSFSCTVNATELPGIFQSISWIKGGEILVGSHDQETSNGSLQISTLQFTVPTGLLSVQCQVLIRLPDTSVVAVKSINATITGYGKISVALCVWALIHISCRPA